MKITVTFDSLEEFEAHMRPQEGFVEDDRPPFAKAQDRIQQLQQEAEAEISKVDTGTGAIVGATPEEMKQIEAEEAAPAVTEDYRVEVRKFLATLNKQTGKNTAKELISQFGASKLTDVKLEDLPALMEKAKEAADA